MKRTALIVILAAAALCGTAHGQKKPKKVAVQTLALETPGDSMSYAIGIANAKQMSDPSFARNMPGFDRKVFYAAFDDVFDKRGTLMDEEEAHRFLRDYTQRMMNESSARNMDEGARFLQENATKPGVVTTPSGLQYKVVREGYGPKPMANDVVRVHYTGWTIDGTVFDDSRERGEAADFKPSGTIKGFSEALQLMSPGARYTVYIPSDLAYGERGAGQQIGPNSVLIFDMELLDIIRE